MGCIADHEPGRSRKLSMPGQWMKHDACTPGVLGHGGVIEVRIVGEGDQQMEISGNPFDAPRGQMFTQSRKYGVTAHALAGAHRA